MVALEIKRRDIVRHSLTYVLIFFGLQSFFFRLATNPQSLQRKSPGLALRIGFPFWHDIVVFLVPCGECHYNTG
jgi:hypothetical protein